MILLKRFKNFTEIYDRRECHVKFHQINRSKITYKFNKNAKYFYDIHDTLLKRIAINMSYNISEINNSKM